MYSFIFSYNVYKGNFITFSIVSLLVLALSVVVIILFSSIFLNTLEKEGKCLISPTMHIMCVCFVARKQDEHIYNLILDVCSQHTNRTALLLMRDLSTLHRQVNPSVK